MATGHQALSGRLNWVDQLRTLAIVLVVNMHACVTYSHVGSWYVKDPPEPDELTKIAFLFWQGHLQAFFMGILFLLGGYFAYGSLRRRGAPGFLRERLLRLGAPTLLYMVLLNPLINIVINPNHDDYGPLGPAYLRYLVHFRFLGGSGPMWFAAALLAFSAALAALPHSDRGDGGGASPEPRAPGLGALAPWALVLVASTFLVRIVQPIGQSVLNMQLCFFPQYILAFAAGVAAAREGWLLAIARSPLARRAGWMGIILGPVALAAVLVGAGILSGKGFEKLQGGWNLPALGLAAWEQLAGLCIGLGALSFCSAKLNRSTPFSRWMAERSFGVYLLHPVVLVLLTIAFRPLVADPFLKVALLTAAGLAGSYLASDLALRIPMLRKIV